MSWQDFATFAALLLAVLFLAQRWRLRRTRAGCRRCGPSETRGRDGRVHLPVLRS